MVAILRKLRDLANIDTPNLNLDGALAQELNLKWGQKGMRGLIRSARESSDPAPKGGQSSQAAYSAAGIHRSKNLSSP
jgi:hypothetical protein